MANLTPSASFDAVPQLETSTFALAGPGAPMNLQAQALLNRTQYLYVQLSNLAPVATSGDYNSLLNRPTLGSAAYQPSSTFATAAQGAKADGAAQASSLSSVAFSGTYGDLNGKPFASDAPQDSNIWGRKSGSWAIVGGDNATLMSDLASTSSGKGAELVGFLQTGAGAVGRTIQDKAYERKTVSDVLPENVLSDVMSGSPTLDHTTYIQRALDNYLNIDFGGNGYSYRVSSALTLRSGHRVSFKGASITQVSPLTPIITFDNQSNVLVDGGYFIGVGTDFNNSPGSLACGIRAWYATNATVRNCSFNNFGNTGISLAYGSNLNVYDNEIIGPGNPTLTAGTSGANVGVLIDKGCSFVFVARNNISETGQGIQTGDSCTNIHIHDNIIKNIAGQHGLYCGGAQINLSVNGNTIDTAPLEGIKVQQYDAPGADSLNVSLSNNIVRNTGSHGIVAVSTATSPVYLTRGVTIVGNVIQNVGVGTTSDGIEITACTDVICSQNVIRGCTRDGIRLSDSINLDISHNIIDSPLNNGIRELSACTNVSVFRNQIYNPASASVSSETNGITVLIGSGWYIDSNIIIDNASKMRYGIFIQGGTTASDSVVGNITQGSTDYGLRIIGTSPSLLRFEGNVLQGGLGSALNAPATQGDVLTSITSAPSFVGQIAVSGGVAYVALNNTSTSGWHQISN